MRLGVSYIAQVADGWARKAIGDVMTAVTGGYHTEHNADDTHGTITATGSITERGRTDPIGNWIDQVFSAGDFTALPTTAVLTVRATGDVNAFCYTLIGRTMLITFALETVQISGAAATTLRLAIPAHAQLERLMYGTFAYNDNGTQGVGIIQADPDSGNYLRLQKNLTGSSTFAVSSALSIVGQIAVEVKETV